MASLRQLRSPIIVMIIGLLATLIAGLLVWRAEEERQQARFASLADAAVNAIETRLSEQRLLLRGAAALFQGSGEVSRAEFSAYVSRLKLPQNHPGVLGVGYAMRVRSKADLDRATRAARADGLAEFAPWPTSKGLPRSVILYLDPATPVNQHALGYDMQSTPGRRAAMERAAETGEATLSGKVTLVQDSSRSDAAGLLLYVPVGRVTGAPVGSAGYKWEGWSYSPLRARELFAAALAKPNLAGAAVEIFDGKPVPGNLLYRAANFPADPRIAVTRTLEFAGRTWTVGIAAAPKFYESAPVTSIWLVLAGGALTSLLLAVLAMQQARSVARTEAEVRRATHELRQANEALIEASRANAEAEAQIRQMQKIEALGQLTGGIAHDFNNMLAVILGNLDLAARRFDQPDKVERAIGAAKDAANRAAELTRRLLAFGRQQPLQPRVLDPNRLVSDMSELLRRTLGEMVSLETVLAPGVWRVEADPGQLENAVLNLAINGRDAMPDGGRLIIETHNCDLDESYVSHHEGVQAGQFVLIAVTDTGLGMAPEVLDRALDPFFTTKEMGKGTGLGLSQVFGFVKQSAGHLKITSDVGKGTTVKIYLQRAHGALDDPTSRPLQAELPQGRGDELVLVVEDEEGVRLTTVAALRDLGYTVIHASSGLEALEMLERHSGVTLLFTDVVMPGMNGRELAERARRQFPHLRVLFTTGYTPNAIVHDGRLNRGVHLVAKPFTMAQLAVKVREVLDQPAEGQG
ncbi:CHASE domain-containing protein [Sphingomonas sp. IC4-52]|uniref:CHASE domain-containing protein n=1 Tax=Sphingomonas sp. IC4-52 TaxID=2887202 RepID=UPI001D0F4AFC|nr:CHASE domain-containing protein [Sphingomonas sp. IC4-52]MCC2981421.1 CHASE domain-containing protein [Sphingomonas sp. IC4-52]